MKKLCLIYANCQNQLIAKYLSSSQHFNQEYRIKRIPVHQLIQQKTTIPANLLKQARLFIYQPVNNIHGDRSTEHILSKLPSSCQSISFPSLYFKGYFPQYRKNPLSKVITPNHPYGVIPHGDTNIISMLGEGQSTSEIIERLSNPNFYREEFVLDNLNQTLEEIARRESELSIKVSSFIKEHHQHHRLFYTQNHPADILGIYVVNQILKLVNIPELGNEFSFNNTECETLDNLQIPIYPSVIKHLGLTFIDTNALYKHGGYCTKRMTFSRYISEYIDLHLSTPESANSYYFQGIEYAKQNNCDKAVEALKKAIQIKPNNASYYGELADVLQKQKKIDQAEKVYKKAIELSPDWVNFYISLAELFIEKNNLRAAILTYKQAVILNPKNDELYNLLGATLVDYGELDLAKTAYNQAIKLKPFTVSYYRCLGDIYRDQNNLDLAIVNYRKGIALAPDHGWLYMRLSAALAQQDKLDEATEMCQLATEFKYKNPSYYTLLGDIQLQIGDVDNALDTYQQAIKLNPNQMKEIFTHLGHLLQGQAEKQEEKAIASVV